MLVVHTAARRSAAMPSIPLKKTEMDHYAQAVTYIRSCEYTRVYERRTAPVQE